MNSLVEFSNARISMISTKQRTIALSTIVGCGILFFAVIDIGMTTLTQVIITHQALAQTSRLIYPVCPPGSKPDPKQTMSDQISNGLKCDNPKGEVKYVPLYPSYRAKMCMDLMLNSTAPSGCFTGTWNHD
jgi:hypothetical protein